MTSLGFDILVKVASDFYSHEVIRDAKKLLFDLVSVSQMRHRVCIGPNKAKEDIRDMLKLLLSAELDQVPMFLAFDLSQLPPMTSDSQDLSSLIRNSEEVKSSIKTLTSANKDLTDLVICQHNKSAKAQSGVESTEIKMRDSPCNEVLMDYRHALLKEPSEDSLSPIAGDLTTESPALQPVKPCRVFTNSTLHRKQQPTRMSRMMRTGADVHTKDPIVIGRGTAPGLRAAQRPLPYNRDRPRGKCTGIFTTNLHPMTTAQQMQSFIRRESGYSVTAEKLPTKYDSYSSFYIKCADNIRSHLLDPHLWPEGCKIKPYYSF